MTRFYFWQVLWCATTLVLRSAASDTATLRGSSSTTTTTTTTSDDSSCNSIRDSDKCNASFDDTTEEECVWCRCAAIPSQCYSMSQSKLAPPGVFECDKYENEHEHEHEHEQQQQQQSNEETTTTTTTTTTTKVDVFPMEFNFVEGITHTISSDEVDGDLCDSSSKSLSGYVDISGSQYDQNGENKHLFYWFFEKRNQDQATTTTTTKQDQDDKKDIPLIVWLTGGPGCSSTLALLTENGPCTVNEDGKSTSVNKYSWTEAAHVLWLDQPAGVGFSYGKENDKNEKMISEDAYYFLQSFFKAHPEYSENPLYIVGESYGGHYAPSIAHRIYIGNQALSSNNNNDNKHEHSSSNNNKDELLHLNLSGVAVGNGLTNPEEQYKWYAEMAYNNPLGIHAVSEATYEEMTSMIPKCTALIHQCNAGDNMVDNFVCQAAFVVCGDAEMAPYQLSGRNPYDIRKPCAHRPLCYDFSHVEKFLNMESTRAALHVTDKSSQWASCNMAINMKFHADFMKDFSPFVADLLDGAKIPVLIYAGDVDFICNYMGNRAWTHTLEWSGGQDFRNKATDHDWSNGKGKARSTADGLFTFLQVYSAGHMVPADQPEVALEMIGNFVSGGSF